jgi:hypothetical protein
MKYQATIGITRAAVQAVFLTKVGWPDISQRAAPASVQE